MMTERRTRLVEEIEAFEPYNEQEAADKEITLALLQGESSLADIFSRENSAYHMTASAWVVNGEKNKVLMAYHNIYDSWSWPGGHADGEDDLLSVAVREVREEACVKAVRPLSSKIFSLEILTVDGHEKGGKYVPSHLHVNVTYLLEADEEEAVGAKPDENKAVRWFGLEEAVEASAEEWFKLRIYAKLNAKLRAEFFI